MTKFSIIVPCFNAKDTLGDTLASITAQTHRNFEIICVDDGSADSTCQIVNAASAADPRIILAQNPGKGPSAARNHGALDLATGDIVAFCDADDLWSPNKLTELKRAFTNRNTDAVFGKIGFFRDNPNSTSVFSTVPQAALTIPMLLGENPVCTMSNFAVRRSIFTISGGFDTRIIHNEDLEFLIRIVGLGANVIGLNSCQTLYRTSHHGLSSDLPAMAEGREVALRTAAHFGYQPTAASNAIYMRYLARRSLRLGHARTQALSYAVKGLLISPVGFFASPKRGLLTLAGAFCAVVLPKFCAKTLFSR